MKFLFILSLFMFQAQALGTDQDSAASQEDEINYRLKAFVQESISQIKINEQGQVIVDKETVTAIENLINKYDITKEEFEKSIFISTDNENIPAKNFLFLIDKKLNFANRAQGVAAFSIIGILAAVVIAVAIHLSASGAFAITVGISIGIVIASIPISLIMFLKHQANDRAIEYLFLIDDLDDLTLIP